VAPVVITEELQQPQITKLDVTAEAPHNITPIMVGAYKSIIYKINGLVVQNGFTEPSRPYIISATIVLEDDSTVQAGEFTIPVVYFTTLVNPSTAGLVSHITASYAAVQFLTQAIDAPLKWYEDYVLTEDGGTGSYGSRWGQGHIGFYVPKTLIEQSNLAIDEDYNMLFEITNKRGMSYYMQPNECFAFDFGTSLNGSWTDSLDAENSSLVGPIVHLSNSGFSLTDSGTSANTLSNTSTYTTINWKTPIDSTGLMWPYEGNYGSDDLINARIHAASKYYMIVEIKAQQKCTVRFYSHADGMGSQNYHGQPALPDQEFFYFEFLYPDAFSKDYVFGLGSKSALKVEKMVITNQQTDLLNVLKNATP